MAVAGACMLVAASAARAATGDYMGHEGWTGWWLPTNYSKHGGAIDWLFNWVFGLTMVTFVLTELVLIVFLIKYRVEFILTFPLFAILFGWYLSIGLENDSAAQAPEKLYRETGLMCFAAFTFVVTCLLLLVDLPFLKWLAEPRLITVKF